MKPMPRIKYNHFYFNTNKTFDYYCVKDDRGKLITKVPADQTFTRHTIKKLHEQDKQDDASNDRYAYHVSTSLDKDNNFMNQDTNHSYYDYNRLLTDNSTNPEYILFNQEEKQAYNKMLGDFKRLQKLAQKELSPSDLEIINLRILQNKKLKEIGEMKGVSPQAIHGKLQRALSNYRIFLEKHGFKYTQSFLKY